MYFCTVIMMVKVALNLSSTTLLYSKQLKHCLVENHKRLLFWYSYVIFVFSLPSGFVTFTTSLAMWCTLTTDQHLFNTTSSQLEERESIWLWMSWASLGRTTLTQLWLFCKMLQSRSAIFCLFSFFF